MSSVLFQAALITFLAAAALSGLVVLFDRLAPRGWVRERHDLALAAYLVTPLVFLAAVMPRPATPEPVVFIANPAVQGPAVAPAEAILATDSRWLPNEDAAPAAEIIQQAEALLPALVWTAGALWLAVSLWLSVRLVLDLLALARLKADARRRPVPEALGLSSRLPVAESDAIVCPMLAGFLSPTILVPAGFELDATARPVLEHEIAHARRGDTWTALGLRLIRIVFWWVWPLAPLDPVIDRNREALCDRDAARITGQPRALASALLDAASAALRTPSLALAAAPTRSGLAQRISHLTAPGALQRKDSPMRFALILPVLAGSALVFTPHVGAVEAGKTDDAVMQAPARSLDDHRDLEASLYYAAHRGRLSEIDRLLEGGANPNVRFRGDGTALIAAVRSGHSEIVDRLLEAGALPDLGVDGDGNPLIAAAARGRSDIVESLLEAGANPNAAQSGDGNPLIAAALRDQDAIARRLIAAGADPNGYVMGDETPLVNAAQQGHMRTARLLVEAGADVSLTVRARDRNGEIVYRSPLSEARRTGHREMERWLLDQGAEHRPPSR
jgi:beta-lactamase regulating signal transducer with metallopeptidase domain